MKIQYLTFFVVMLCFPLIAFCDQLSTMENDEITTSLPKSFIEVQETKDQNNTQIFKIVYDCFCSPSSFIVDYKNQKLDLSQVCNPAGIWDIKDIRLVDETTYVFEVYLSQDPSNIQKVIITKISNNIYQVDLRSFSNDISFYTDSEKNEGIPVEEQDCEGFDG